MPIRQICPSVHAELCGAARVGMLRPERFAEMRQRFLRSKPRGFVIAATFVHTSVRGDDNINYQGIVAVPSPQADFSHPIC